VSSPGPTRQATTAAIFVAARRLFSERGYAGTPVRDIAAEAGVDAALVIRYFGSKELLFIETMKVEIDPVAMLDGPIETLGESFIDFVLRSGEQTRSIFLALLRASDTDGINLQLRSVHEAQFVEPLRARLSGDDADVRAHLAAALVGGMLYSLWVVGDEYLAAADHQELVTHYGALLQQLITPRP
jgi:AcrR family transcriptional regulator